MNKNWILLHKWIALTIIILAAGAYLYTLGFITIILDNDTSNISYMILAVLGMFYVMATGRVISISHKMKILSVPSVEKRTLLDNYEGLDSLSLKLFGDINYLRYWLIIPVTLGLLGTMIGFYNMIPEGVTISNADDAAVILGSMVVGLKIAFTTTMVGLVIGTVMSLLFQLIETATGTLINAIVASRG